MTKVIVQGPGGATFYAYRMNPPVKVTFPAYEAMIEFKSVIRPIHSEAVKNVNIDAIYEGRYLKGWLDLMPGERPKVGDIGQVEVRDPYGPGATLLHDMVAVVDVQERADSVRLKYSNDPKDTDPLGFRIVPEVDANSNVTHRKVTFAVPQGKPIGACWDGPPQDILASLRAIRAAAARQTGWEPEADEPVTVDVPTG